MFVLEFIQKINSKPHLFVWICSVIKHYKAIFIFQCRTRPSSRRLSHFLRGKMTEESKAQWIFSGRHSLTKENIGVVWSHWRRFCALQCRHIFKIYSQLYSPMSAHGNYIYSQGKVMIMAKSSWFYCIYLLYERQTLVSDVKVDWPIHHPDLLTLHPWSHYPGKNSVVRIPPHLECMLVFIFHSVRASIMWAWHYFLPQHINHTHFPVLALENIIGRMSFGAESSSMNISDRYRQVGGISTENLMKWRLRRPDTAQVSRQLEGSGDRCWKACSRRLVARWGMAGWLYLQGSTLSVQGGGLRWCSCLHGNNNEYL